MGPEKSLCSVNLKTNDLLLNDDLIEKDAGVAIDPEFCIRYPGITIIDLYSIMIPEFFCINGN